MKTWYIYRMEYCSAVQKNYHEIYRQMDEMRKKKSFWVAQTQRTYIVSTHLHVDIICKVFYKQVTIHITMEVSYTVRD